MKTRAVAVYCIAILFMAFPVIAQEEKLAGELRDELKAIEAVLNQYEAAGEKALAKQEVESLRKRLAGTANFLETKLANTIEARKTPLFRSLEKADAEIDRLEAISKTDANRLRALLDPIRKADTTGEFDFSKSVEPEVHSVHLPRGIALPKELGTKEERVHLGFAEVNLDYTARPVVLLLRSNAPIRWKVNLADGAHVHACLLYTSPSPRDKRQSRMPSSA